mmetsp:Transcript_26776/g.62145  ORF Transcript_26776/g.62145 Transcript_26776/m.62145 type:complete len:382 (+) Transcript_26776:598-1743(+)
MQVCRDTRPEVHILPDAPKLAGVVEVTCANGLANNVPVGANGIHLESLLLHNLFKLSTHFPNFLQGLLVHEVITTPSCTVAVVTPLLVHIQQREVVALRHEKFLPRCIALICAVLWSEENRGHGEHGHDSHDLLAASELFAHNQHLRQRWIQWKLRHLVSQRSNVSQVVQRTQHPELEQGVEDCILWWRVHETERQQVFDTHGLQQKHDIGQIRALDLWNCHCQHLRHEGTLRVESPTCSRPSSSSTASALVGVCLRNRRHLQAVHTHLWVVDLELAIACVNDILDAIDGQGGLSNIGSHDDLPLVAALEDFGLEIRGQLRVDGQDRHWRHLLAHLGDSVRQQHARCLNVFLTCHEDQDISLVLTDVNCDCLLNGGIHIVL